MRPRDAANTRARGASGEEGARWSFQARENGPRELNLEGGEGCFRADGYRHRDVGGHQKSSADTTCRADAALHGAVLGKRFVIRVAGLEARLIIGVVWVVMRKAKKAPRNKAISKINPA